MYFKLLFASKALITSSNKCNPWLILLNGSHFPNTFFINLSLNAKPRMGQVGVTWNRAKRAEMSGQTTHWWLKGSLGEKIRTKQRLEVRMRNVEMNWWWKKRWNCEQERCSESLSDRQQFSRGNETSDLELHNGKKKIRKHGKACNTWAVC